jgi:hypothetical protein
MAGYPVYGIACDRWNGHPALHQQEARRVLGRVPAFTWVTTVCTEKLCVAREHLTVVQPQILGYQPGICIYCGLDATTMDHLVPEPWTGEAARRLVVTVPACRECNTMICDRLTWSITERRAYAHEQIRAKYGKWLKCRIYTPSEVREFGRNLRTVVQEGTRMRAVTEARLSWPEDPFYDLHAAQAAGIENPYIIGMIEDADPVVSA